MYTDNALKIGLFGSNCSSGRAVTMVPERWTGNWEDNLALARMADEAGIEFMLPVGRWKGYGGDTDYMGTTLETITWATGLLANDQAADRVRHRARAAVPSDHRRQAVRHRRPHRRRAASASTSWSAGTRTSSRCSASRSASTSSATSTPRTGSTRSRWPGAPEDDFDFDGQVHQAQEGPRQAEALRRHAAADHERRRLAGRPRLRDPQLRRVLHPGVAHLDGGDRGAREGGQGRGQQRRAASSTSTPSASSPAGRRRRRPRSTTTTPRSRTPTGRRSTASSARRTSRPRPSARRSSSASASTTRTAWAAC